MFRLCLQFLLQTLYAVVYYLRVTCNTSAEKNSNIKCPYCYQILKTFLIPDTSLQLLTYNLTTIIVLKLLHDYG
jgi:hypothetical protein